MEAAPARDATSRRAAEAARAEALARSSSSSARCSTRRRSHLGDTFQALAAEALRTSQEDFLTLASERLGAVRDQTAMDVEARQQAQQQALEGMVAPVRASLEKVDEQIRAMERERGTAYGELRQQLVGVGDAGEAARRDRQPGERAEGAGGARALGRDAAPPRRRAGRACSSTATSTSR